MMRLAYDPAVGERVLIDACGCAHRRADIEATIRTLEARYLRVRYRPGRYSRQVAGWLERALAQRYVYLHVLDGHCGLLHREGIDDTPL